MKKTNVKTIFVITWSILPTNSQFKIVYIYIKNDITNIILFVFV